MSAAAFAATIQTATAASRKAASDRSEEVRGNSVLLSYEGRTAVMGDGSVLLGFPGVVLRVRFNGARLVLRSTTSSANQYVNVSVDGGTPKLQRLLAGTEDLVVFDGNHGDHCVEIARRNESWQGVWTILGATVYGGQFQRPLGMPEKRLLFIGDSVTCGVACDVARDDPRLDSSTDNGQKSYAKVLAKRMNAQCHLVSYGGRGIIRDWQGIRDTRNAPQFYELAAPDEPAHLWDARNYVPDAIGVMLGTNDFNQGIPDQNEFINAFVEFIEKIRRDAPNASVLLLGSPIVTDENVPKRSVLAAYLMEIARRCASSSVAYVPVGHYPGRTVNAHPSAEEHVAIANELEANFRKALERRE